MIIKPVIHTAVVFFHVFATASAVEYTVTNAGGGFFSNGVTDSAGNFISGTQGAAAFGYFDSDSAVTTATSAADLLDADWHIAGDADGGCETNFNNSIPLKGTFSISCNITDLRFHDKNVYLVLGNASSLAASTQFFVYKFSVKFKILAEPQSPQTLNLVADDSYGRICIGLIGSAQAISSVGTSQETFIMISPAPMLAHPENPATPPTSNAISFSRSTAGKYSGFLKTLDGKQLEGYFKNINLTAAGAFSAIMTFDATSYILKGRFDDSGRYYREINLESGSVVTLDLQLVQTPNGAYKLEGTVEKGNQTATVDVVKSGDTSHLKGSYTLLVPGKEDEPGAPQGHGYATMSVSGTGVATIQGHLGDGSKWKAQCYVTADGEMPLYSDLYISRRGSLGGMIRFRNVEGVSDCDGEIHWFKPGGFDMGEGKLERNLIGSIYIPQQVIAGGPDTKPYVMAELGEDFAFEAALRELGWTVFKKQKVQYAGAGNESLTLSVEGGLIKGSIPQLGVEFKVAGVVFQKQDLAAGMVSAKQVKPRSLVIVPVE